MRHKSTRPSGLRFRLLTHVEHLNYTAPCSLLPSAGESMCKSPCCYRLLHGREPLGRQCVPDSLPAVFARTSTESPAEVSLPPCHYVFGADVGSTRFVMLANIVLDREPQASTPIPCRRSTTERTNMTDLVEDNTICQPYLLIHLTCDRKSTYLHGNVHLFQKLG